MPLNFLALSSPEFIFRSVLRSGINYFCLAGSAATETAATLRSRPDSCNLLKLELIAAASTEVWNGFETCAESGRWLSTLNDSRTNFVSTPKIDNLKRRL